MLLGNPCSSCLNCRLSLLHRLVHCLRHLLLSAPTLACQPSRLSAFYSFHPFHCFLEGLFSLRPCLAGLRKGVEYFMHLHTVLCSCPVNLCLAGIGLYAAEASTVSAFLVCFRFIHAEHIHSSYPFIAEPGILLYECTICLSLHQLKDI